MKIQLLFIAVAMMVFYNPVESRAADLVDMVKAGEFVVGSAESSGHIGRAQDGYTQPASDCFADYPDRVCKMSLFQTGYLVARSSNTDPDRSICNVFSPHDLTLIDKGTKFEIIGSPEDLGMSTIFTVINERNITRHRTRLTLKNSENDKPLVIDCYGKASGERATINDFNSALEGILSLGGASGSDGEPVGKKERAAVTKDGT